MLHPLHLVRVLALAVLVGLLAPLATAAPATAQDDGDTPRVARLLEHADGRLEVVTGLRFAVNGAEVLAKEVDVVLSTGTVDDLIDATTGLVTDAMRRDQWNLSAVQAETAWLRSTGTEQTIAIVDSGVDGTHPDLRDRLVAGYSATGGDALVDGHGHGTHVAGTAAASIGGGYGVAGLAPDAAIMPVQVTDTDGLAFASHVAEGLIWAVDNGATVANLSLAGTRESTVLNGAIDYAVSKGVVVIVAGGNEATRDNPRTYPASHPDVIAVAAMRDLTSRASFSSTGDWIDLAAPGSSILSTRPGETFGYASGTSMAAPLVAGAAALLRAADPTLDVEGVRRLLQDTASDIGAPGRDDEFGHGALDVLRALELITDAPAVPEVPQIPEVVADEEPADDADAEDEDPTHQGTAPPPLSRIDGVFSPEAFGR